MAGALMFASCEDEKDEEKVLPEKPAPSGISGAKHDICGDVVTLTATAVTGATSYVWYKGSDSITETTANTYGATAVGSYFVAAKNEGGLSEKSDAWEIVNGCVGVPIAITQDASDGYVLLSVDAISGAATYSWYRADAENGTYTQVASVDTANGKINAARLYRATEVGWYTVAGANSDGEGARATPVHVATIPTPQPPVWNTTATTTTAYVDSTITLSVAGMMADMPYIKYLWYELLGTTYTEILPSDSTATITLTKSDVGEYKFAVKRLNTQIGLTSGYSETHTVTVTVPSAGGDSEAVSLNDFFEVGDTTFRVYEKISGGWTLADASYTITVKKHIQYGFTTTTFIQILGLGGADAVGSNVTFEGTDAITLDFRFDENNQELVADTTYEEPFYPRASGAKYTGYGKNTSKPEVYFVSPVAGSAVAVTNVVKAEVKKIDGKITIFIPSKELPSGKNASYSYYAHYDNEGGTDYRYLDFFTSYGIDATDYGWPDQTGVIIKQGGEAPAGGGGGGFPGLPGF
jgi:hypothetical protein